MYLLGVLRGKKAKKADVYVPVNELVLLVKEAVSGAESRVEWESFAVGDTAEENRRLVLLNW